MLLAFTIWEDATECINEVFADSKIPELEQKTIAEQVTSEAKQAIRETLLAETAKDQR